MTKLDSLRDAFANQNKKNRRTFFPFWTMQEGSTLTVRFLPDLDEDNPLGFLVENLEHELVINNEKQHLPCISMYGQSCSICQLSREYYSEKNEPAGKKYYRKKSYIG